MSEEKNNALCALRDYQCVPWDAIPDFGLYMDQVITLLTKMYAPLYGREDKSFLSASMINNYVKAKLIPRPEGKKYNRDQIALLALIVALKQVASMEDIRELLCTADAVGVRALYERFCDKQSATLRDIADSAEASRALDCAIAASAYQCAMAHTLRDQPN